MTTSLTAMIPARIGSTRLKKKNLALINGKPLISYAVESAIQSRVFDRIVINSDDLIFKEIADRLGVEFYLRDPALGGSSVKSDDVVSDFMHKFPSDVVAWVNSTSPLMTGDELRGIMESFLDQGLDSLITVEAKQVHCDFEGAPVNYRKDGKFAQTQDLVPVHVFVYSVMAWRCQPFQEAMAKHGEAMFCGKFGTLPVSKESAVIIKTEEDLRFAEALMQARGRTHDVQYFHSTPSVESEL